MSVTLGFGTVKARFILPNLIAAFLILAAGLAAGTLAAEPLDLDDPTGAVKGLRKLQCQMEDGKPAIFWWTGVTYSRVPGEVRQR